MASKINDITVTLTTRGRYHSTLPMCLMSICTQSFLPGRIILVDDNERKEFQNIEVFKNIQLLLKYNGIQFDYYHGESRGQVYAQQLALDKVKTDWVFKLDDDNILESNVIEELSKNMDKLVGAVSCLILTPPDVNRKLEYESNTYNRMEDIYSSFNIQMYGKQSSNIKWVEHLHGCYLFQRKAMRGYPLAFSPSGHREDTVFTHEIFRNGYILAVNPNAVMWHLKEENGGNRLHKDNNNESLFLEKLKEWKIIPEKMVIFKEGELTYTMKNCQKYAILI
jgi:cellulose synthase/poly-beta-1,6-N-acetylglucosamine synthase-like glycosyltransferase